MSTPARNAGPATPEATKQCCARFYESDLVSRLLGDSFHPGGTRLTHHLGVQLSLSPDDHVLDIASGLGQSVLYLAEQFGCRVTGLELSPLNVDRARATAAARGLDDRVTFDCGDAERLPAPDGSATAVICECAFCTFPDKAVAASELARVLGASGRIGLSDVTRAPEAAAASPSDLDDLMGWVACLADARPAETYVDFLSAAGFAQARIERHDDALRDLVADLRRRLLAAEVLSGLNKLSLPGVDFATANRLARAASRAIDAGLIGYATITMTKAID